MDVLGAALAGLDQAQGQFEQSVQRLLGPAASSSGSVQPSGDSVDLSQAAVSLLSAKNQFALNVNLLKVADEMQKTTINMLA